VFVRWKERTTKRGRVFYAVLVESQRENGKPRQKVIKHLAHIAEKYLDATAHQEYFWQRVDWYMDDLALSTETRKTIEGKLIAKVKRPTEEELVQLRKEQKAISRWFQ